MSTLIRFILATSFLAGASMGAAGNVALAAFSSGPESSSDSCWMTVTLDNGDLGIYNGCSGLYMFPDGSTSPNKHEWPIASTFTWQGAAESIWNNFWTEVYRSGNQFSPNGYKRGSYGAPGG